MTFKGWRHVALIGRAGAGKDTAGEYLVNHFGYTRVAFADKLKDVAAAIWGESARTDRVKLQLLGQYVREIDEDAWVNAALRDAPDDGRPIVITDCRYQNEARRLSEEGFGIVRVSADRTVRLERLAANGKLADGTAWERHISEVDLDEYPVHFAIDNTHQFPAAALESAVRALSRPAWVDR